jgi:hypothetical protein
MEEDLIIELWDVFKEYISEKNREVAANQYVDFLLGKDVELEVLEGLTGYDPHLDDAIQLVVGEEKEQEDPDDEDNWDFDEDQED